MTFPLEQTFPILSCLSPFEISFKSSLILYIFSFSFCLLGVFSLFSTSEQDLKKLNSHLNGPIALHKKRSVGDT